MKETFLTINNVIMMLSVLSREDKIIIAENLLKQAENPDEEDFFMPYSKEELLARAEKGRRQIENGEYYTSDEVFKIVEERYETAEAV